MKMNHYVNLIMEDLEGYELFVKEKIELGFIPRIGEYFDYVLKDNSLYEEIYENEKINGRIRVLEVRHTYLEMGNTHSVTLILAFANDKRFL